MNKPMLIVLIIYLRGIQFIFNNNNNNNSNNNNHNNSLLFYYIPIVRDTSFELCVFWPSDTESRINELGFSDSVSLSFKTTLTLVTCFCGDVT